MVILAIARNDVTNKYVPYVVYKNENAQARVCLNNAGYILMKNAEKKLREVWEKHRDYIMLDTLIPYDKYETIVFERKID